MSDLSIVIISERRTARGCSQQGVRFDPDMPQTIRLEFAKSNTKVSKPKPAVATAAPAAHPALMHPLTGRKYRQRTHRPGARSTAPLSTRPAQCPHTTNSRPSDMTLSVLITTGHGPIPFLVILLSKLIYPWPRNASVILQQVSLFVSKNFFFTKFK